MRQTVPLWKYLRVGALLAVTGCAAAHLRAPGGRTLEGAIIFTNNTPGDLATFPAEVYTPDQRRRVAATTASAQGDFTLTGIQSGNYLLRLAWPAKGCVVWYRVDLTDGSKEVHVLMDVDCAHHNGGVTNPYRIEPLQDQRN